MELIKEFKQENLHQSAQTQKHQFFWCAEKDGVLVPQTSKFICRDYFNEVWWKWHKGETLVKVYGFTADLVTKDTGGDVYIGMFFGDNPEERISFMDNLPKIHDIENENEFSKTEIVYEDDEHCVVLRFDRKWCDNPTILYAYTWLLRLATYKKGLFDVSEGSDYTLLKHFNNLPKKILQNTKLLYEVEPKVIDSVVPKGYYTMDFHNGCGLYSLAARVSVLVEDAFTSRVKGLNV